MYDRNVKHHEQATQVFQSSYEDIVRLRQQAEKDAHAAEITELLDTWYCMYECEKLYERLRKEHSKFKTLLEKLLCLLWINTSSEDTLRSEYCTASPDLGKAVPIPTQQKDPEKFAEFMRWLGVEESAIADEVVRPHYPGLQTHISRLLSEGKPLPPGVDESVTYPAYKLHMKYRRKPVSGEGSGSSKELIEEATAPQEVAF